MKKLLAIILATVMVAAMLPVGIVSALDVQMDTYKYVFSNDAHTETDGKGATSFNATTIPMSSTISETSAPWGFVNTGRTDVLSGGNYYGGAFTVRYEDATGMIYFRVNSAADGASGPWQDGMDVPELDVVDTYGAGYSYPMAMIQIEVLKAGVYVPSMVLAYAGSNQGVISEIYLIKNEGDNEEASIGKLYRAASSENRVGVVDFYASTGTETFAPITLEKGVYNMLFVVNGRSAAAKAAGPTYSTFDMAFQSLTLTQIPGAALVGSEIGFDFSTAAVKDSVLGEATALPLTEGGKTDGANSATLAANKATLSSYDFVDTADSGKWALVPAQAVYLSGLTVSRAGTIETQVDANGLTVANALLTQRIVLNGIHYDESLASAGLCKGTDKNPHFTLMVNVPIQGKYDLYMENAAFDIPGDGVVNVFAVPVAGAASDLYNTYVRGTLNTVGITNGARPMITSNYVGTRAAETVTEGKVGSFEATVAGDYYIIFELDTNATPAADKEKYPPNGKGDPNHWETKNETSFTLKNMTLKYTETPAATGAALVKEQQQNVDPENAEKEAVNTSIANVTVYAKDIDGNAIDYNNGIVTTITAAEVGSTQLLTAPEIPGYRFDYWARGIGENSRPVSTNPEYVFKATKGGSKFYAVYSVKGKSETCWVEFYDANRELVERTKYVAGETVTVPALPSSSARGQALIWASAVSDYEFNYEGGETFTAPHRAILAFVAQYSDDDASLKEVNVEVAGTTGATGEDSYKFGSTVTVVAPARENNKGTKVFAYWMKDGEIVSFEKSYSFVATTDVTVTAYYQDYAPIATSVRKILVDSVGTGTNTEVFAEFIGCEDAIERGFIFGDANVTLDSATAKASMKTNAKSFSMINDIEGATAKAYAIFTDGVIYSK